VRQASAEEREILEEKLQFARGELKVVSAERDRLLAHRDQLLSRLANVQSQVPLCASNGACPASHHGSTLAASHGHFPTHAQLSRVDEDTEADTDALDAEPTNRKMERLRKQDMLALRAELDGAKAALAKEKVLCAIHVRACSAMARSHPSLCCQQDRASAQFQELGVRGAECDSLRQQLAANTKLVSAVTDENSSLHMRVKELTAEASATFEPFALEMPDIGRDLLYVACRRPALMSSSAPLLPRGIS